MNAEEFIEYLQEQVKNGSIYVYGAQGQTAPTVCEKWIRKMEANTGGTLVKGRYTTYAEIAVAAWKKKVAEGYGDVLRAFDCSGLGVYFFLKHNLIAHDMTANGLMGLCQPVSEPERGFWVFRTQNGRAVHIGYLVSADELVEAKGRADGVVKREYKPSEWNAIGKPRIFEFAPEPQPDPPGPPAPTEKLIKVKGNVRVRTGNGTQYPKIGTAHDELLPYLGQAEDPPNWYQTVYDGQEGYITSNPRYTEVIEK